MDERVSKRELVDAKGSLRSGSGIALQVNVVDFSKDGCRIEPAPRYLAVGDVLSLRLAGIGPFSCSVRWCNTGKDAGLQFEFPLYPAIYDHLLRLWIGYGDPSGSEFEFHKLRAEIRLV